MKGYGWLKGNRILEEVTLASIFMFPVFQQSIKKGAVPKEIQQKSSFYA